MAIVLLQHALSGLRSYTRTSLFARGRAGMTRGAMACHVRPWHVT